MQTPDKDRLDIWLDQALRQQGDTEPRPGLESRLLANLSARQRKRTRAVWVWTLSGAAAAAFLLVMFVQPGVERHEVPPNNEEVANVAHAVSRQPKPKASVPGVARMQSGSHQSRGAILRANMAAASPRLNHFPSVRLPAPQELTLARYVERYPAEAALIAAEQENFDLGVQKTQQEIESETVISNQ